MADLAPIIGERRRAPDFLTLMGHAGTLAAGASPILARADRRRIEAHIESLIAMLDVIDGDADEEDHDPDRCEAGDDGCGVFVHWSRGALWGAEA